MKRIKLIFSTLLIILSLSIATAHAKYNQNTISFDNQSGESALVKLIGPIGQTIEVPTGKSRKVNVCAGEYYILVRYGSKPNQYTYSKGKPFKVTQSATQYSVITITLHKVIGGNYPTYPTSNKEFDKTLVTVKDNEPESIKESTSALPSPDIQISPPMSSKLSKMNAEIVKIRQKPIIAKQASDYEPVSGPNWEFRVLSIENTGKQKWKSSGSKLGKIYHIGIKEENMSFWRIKAEIKRKIHGIDFDSQWIKLIYRMYKGEQKSVEAAANIMNIMGEEVASTGSFKISFGRKKLSKPLELDLLFLAPKNNGDIKYMDLQFLDYTKINLISK